MHSLSMSIKQRALTGCVPAHVKHWQCKDGCFLCAAVCISPLAHQEAHAVAHSPGSLIVFRFLKTFECPAPVLTDPDIDRLLEQIVSKLTKFRGNLKCRTPSNWMIFWPRCKCGFWDMFNGKERVHCPIPVSVAARGLCLALAYSTRRGP